jgi:hypothetical protein
MAAANKLPIAPSVTLRNVAPASAMIPVLGSSIASCDRIVATWASAILRPSRQGSAPQYVM